MNQFVLLFSQRYMFGEKMDTLPVRCIFPAAEIPKGREVRFAVRPVESFGRRGEPIATGFEKREWKEDGKKI